MKKTTTCVTCGGPIAWDTRFSYFAPEHCQTCQKKILEERNRLIEEAQARGEPIELAVDLHYYRNM